MSDIIHVITCSGPPTVAPLRVGQHWVDTTNGDMYFSVGTSSVADWVPLIGSDKDLKTYTCPAGVAVNDIVYSSGLDTVDQAIANDVNKKYAIGMVYEKPTATTAVVVSIGKYSGFSGLTQGLPVFLSTSTLGGITQTPPTGAGNWLQILGMAVDADKIDLNLSPPIKRT